jgi:hypothetical protein
MEFRHIQWQEGRCLCICPYKCGTETLGFPTWMWKDNSYHQLLHITNKFLDCNTHILGTLCTNRKGNTCNHECSGNYTTDVAWQKICHTPHHMQFN